MQQPFEATHAGDSAARERARRPCPLCAGTISRPDFPYGTVYAGTTFHYFRCQTCGCVYADPVPTAEQFRAMYAPEAYHAEHYADAASSEAYRVSARMLAQHRGHRTTLLDFGCGTGEFLIAAAREGFQVQGVEFHPHAIANAQQRAGVPVNELGTLRARGARFDIIHLQDVFEHLPDPRSTMLELRELLNPRGLFFVEGPLQSNPSLVYYTSKSLKWLRRRLGDETLGTSPPTHLILVDQKAQDDFFTKRMGYRRVFFEVSETGWPYLLPRRQPGLQGLIKEGIGRAACALGRVEISGRHPLGNRFMGLFEVPADAPGSETAAAGPRPAETSEGAVARV